MFSCSFRRGWSAYWVNARRRLRNHTTLPHHTPTPPTVPTHYSAFPCPYPFTSHLVLRYAVLPMFMCFMSHHLCVSTHHTPVKLSIPKVAFKRDPIKTTIIYRSPWRRRRWWQRGLSCMTPPPTETLALFHHHRHVCLHSFSTYICTVSLHVQPSKL